MTESMNVNLQQNVLSLLLFSEQHAKLVRSTLPLDCWSQDPSILALVSSAYQYIDTHKQPPAAHTLDLISTLPVSDSQKQILGELAEALDGRAQDPQFNLEYVMNELNSFYQRTNISGAIQRGAECIARGRIDEAKQVLLQASKLQVEQVRPAKNLFSGLLDVVMRGEVVDLTKCVPLGIGALDKRHIAPFKQELFMFLAPTGKGKSWFLIHCGKKALIQGWNVLHLSLEMSLEALEFRYGQSLFGLAKDYDPGRMRTTLQQLDFGKAVASPNYVASDPASMNKFLDRVVAQQDMLKRLRYERFPTQSLTVPALVAYLDTLEMQDGFVPDMVIIDYAKLMKLDKNNTRISLGLTVEELRGLSQERNFALVTAAQTNKEGAKTNSVDATHIGEDWSQVQTSDVVLSYTSTDTESLHKLARIGAVKVRNCEDNFEILITQDYNTGQFCLNSVELSKEWKFKLNELTGN